MCQDKRNILRKNYKRFKILEMKYSKGLQKQTLYTLISLKDFKIGIIIPILKIWKLRLREAKMNFNSTKRRMKLCQQFLS